jgi:hypothetical protein
MMSHPNPRPRTAGRGLRFRSTFGRLPIALLVACAILLPGCGGDKSRGEPPTYTTNIYLAPLTYDGDRVVVGPPINLTDREGYDNQPAFLADGRGLLFASRVGDQVEIFRYDFDSEGVERLTETQEREYQPTPIPGDDGFSVIRVELNGSQRLWRFAPDGSEPRVILESPENARYHAWADGRTVAIVDADIRPSLWVGAVDGPRTFVLDEIGRSVQGVPGRRALSFVHKIDFVEWWIKEWDADSGTVRPLVLTRPGCEDHAWTPSGLLLMGQDSRLFQWRPAPDAGWDDWQVAADLADHGIQQITRVAVNPAGDMLALVSKETDQP